MVHIRVEKNKELLFEGSFSSCSINQQRDLEREYGMTKDNWGVVTKLTPVPGSEITTITLSK